MFHHPLEPPDLAGKVLRLHLEAMAGQVVSWERAIETLDSETWLKNQIYEGYI